MVSELHISGAQAYCKLRALRQEQRCPGQELDSVTWLLMLEDLKALNRSDLLARFEILSVFMHAMVRVS